MKILGPEKPGPRKTCAMKKPDSEKHEKNMRSKNIFDFRELYFMKTIRSK